MSKTLFSELGEPPFSKENFEIAKKEILDILPYVNIFVKTCIREIVPCNNETSFNKFYDFNVRIHGWSLSRKSHTWHVRPIKYTDSNVKEYFINSFEDLSEIIKSINCKNLNKAG